MSIKTWQERVADENAYWGGNPSGRTDELAMQAEIDELRAALAAKLVPMTEAERRGLIAQVAHDYPGTESDSGAFLDLVIQETEAHHSRKLGGVAQEPTDPEILGCIPGGEAHYRVICGRRELLEFARAVLALKGA